MRNICIRKGLVVGIIVLFIGMSVVSSNAVSIQKEISADKVTSETFTLTVRVYDAFFPPFEHGSIVFAKLGLILTV